MKLYAALREMRKAKTPFCVVWCKYSQQRDEGGGLKEMSNAVCGPLARNENENHMIAFVDPNRPEEPPRRCYIHSLMYYNGKKLIL